MGAYILLISFDFLHFFLLLSQRRFVRSMHVMQFIFNIHVITLNRFPYGLTRICTSTLHVQTFRHFRDAHSRCALRGPAKFHHFCNVKARTKTIRQRLRPTTIGDNLRSTMRNDLMRTRWISSELRVMVLPSNQIPCFVYDVREYYYYYHNQQVNAFNLRKRDTVGVVGLWWVEAAATLNRLMHFMYKGCKNFVFVFGVLHYNINYVDIVWTY